jgi:hypothetical protein
LLTLASTGLRHLFTKSPRAKELFNFFLENGIPCKSALATCSLVRCFADRDVSRKFYLDRNIFCHVLRSSYRQSRAPGSFYVKKIRTFVFFAACREVGIYKIYLSVLFLSWCMTREIYVFPFYTRGFHGPHRCRTATSAAAARRLCAKARSVQRLALNSTQACFRDRGGLSHASLWAGSQWSISQSISWSGLAGPLYDNNTVGFIAPPRAPKHTGLLAGFQWLTMLLLYIHRVMLIFFLPLN